MDKKYTIKDIAELAGVSKGTVDRVLHGRGKVSDKALKSVEKVLLKIDYQPNPIARNLKNNKLYNISVLLPDPKQDDYWSPAVKGIKAAAKEFKAFGIIVKRYYYKPSDSTSFLAKSEEALLPEPDVLLTAALFQKEAQEIFSNCEKKNILVALFNNYIGATSSKIFIGQDLFQSGRLAANLIDKLTNKNAKIAVLHIEEEGHMKLKEDGFKAYFKELNSSVEIETHSLKISDDKLFTTTCKNLIKPKNNFAAYFVTNSKSYLFLKAIGSFENNAIVVGYDLLSENIAYLKEGTIDFLIHQKPRRQAYLSVECLAEHFLFGKPLLPRNLLPIDIITTENIGYYLD